MRQQADVVHDRSFYGAAMRGALHRHAPLYAIAAIALLAAFIVGLRTGNQPDLGILRQFGFYILVALWIGGCAGAIGRLLWLAAVERHPSPLIAFLRSIEEFFRDPDRIANTVNGLAIVAIFFSAFGVLKGAIAILSPFAWDEALMDFDRWLHFGRLPHEYLWWILDHPAIVQWLNLAYNFWFVILITAIFVAVVTKQDSIPRQQFLMSFMATWLIGGFLVAIGFSSAGPCYFAAIGLGDTYLPLMEMLRSIDQTHPLWALDTQEKLWNGFVGARDGSAGISAFPSMHVALAVLIAIYFSHRSLVLGAMLWLFAFSILIGSVLLGWHYAIDGYAGAAIAWMAWSVAGRWACVTARSAEAGG